MPAGLRPGLALVLPEALGLSLYVSGCIGRDRPISTMQPLSIIPAFVPAPTVTITVWLEMGL